MWQRFFLRVMLSHAISSTPSSPLVLLVQVLPGVVTQSVIPYRLTASVVHHGCHWHCMLFRPVQTSHPSHHTLASACTFLPRNWLYDPLLLIFTTYALTTQSIKFWRNMSASLLLKCERRIQGELDPLRPIYRQNTNYGHFGRSDLPWEDKRRKKHVL